MLFNSVAKLEKQHENCCKLVIHSFSHIAKYCCFSTSHFLMNAFWNCRARIYSSHTHTSLFLRQSHIPWIVIRHNANVLLHTDSSNKLISKVCEPKRTTTTVISIWFTLERQRRVMCAITLQLLGVRKKASTKWIIFYVVTWLMVWVIDPYCVWVCSFFVLSVGHWTLETNFHCFFHFSSPILHIDDIRTMWNEEIIDNRCRFESLWILDSCTIQMDISFFDFVPNFIKSKWVFFFSSVRKCVWRWSSENEAQNIDKWFCFSNIVILSFQVLLIHNQWVVYWVKNWKNRWNSNQFQLKWHQNKSATRIHMLESLEYLLIGFVSSECQCFSIRAHLWNGVIARWMTDAYEIKSK